SAGRLLEVQIVDAADSLAYDSHDADDAVEIGLLAVEELDAAALWRTAAARARTRYTALDADQFRRAAVHELIDVLVGALLKSASRRLAAENPENASAVLHRNECLIGPSQEISEQKAELEHLLREQVYRHPIVLEQRAHAGQALRSMFARIVDDPLRLPPN